MNTTWPLSWESVQVFPCLSTRVKSGAIFPTSATFGPCPQEAMNRGRQHTRTMRANFFTTVCNLPNPTLAGTVDYFG